MGEPFTWRDGERTIHFGDGAVGRAPALLAEHGFGAFTLLTTPRLRGAAPAVVEAARAVVEVPPGKVDEISAALLDTSGGRPLVALGGGRVIDTAKAVAAVAGQRVATLATTLSGAELTRSHRRPLGVADAPAVRPALVVADPGLMASADPAPRAASAMNALAHALEALYTPYANPVCDLAALRGAELLARGVEAGGRADLALGALMAGYASGAADFAVHHAVCQTIVRTAGSRHAETNAVMLPHSARLMLPRAPEALGRFAGALGDAGSEPAAVPGLLARLAAYSGHVRLRTLGVEEGHVDRIVAAVVEHPRLRFTPDPPDAEELRDLVESAL